MKNKIISTLAIISVLSLTGCAGTQTRLISDAEDQEFVTSSLSGSDFENAAKKMITTMLEEIPNDKVYIMHVEDIKNHTQQRINTDDLTDYIRRELRRSGKVKTTNAFGENRSKTIASARDLAGSSLVDQSTVKKAHRVKAFDLTLEGRIEQKSNQLNKKQKIIEYTFSLKLVDTDDGTDMWSDITTIKKLAGKDDLTW